MLVPHDWQARDIARAIKEPTGGVLNATCIIDECNRKVFARNWCGRHYKRWYKYGDPLAGNPIFETDLERFFSYVEKTPTHWYWRGTVVKSGHGQFALNGKMLAAHRYAYEQLIGPIPDGYEIDHVCRVRNCVRPEIEHLEAVTPRVNALRGFSPPALHARKTHCVRGHPFSEDNTYYPARGGRVCKQCAHLSYLRWKERKNASSSSLPS